MPGLPTQLWSDQGEQYNHLQPGDLYWGPDRVLRTKGQGRQRVLDGDAQPDGGWWERDDVSNAIPPGSAAAFLQGKVSDFSNTTPSPQAAADGIRSSQSAPAQTNTGNNMSALSTNPAYLSMLAKKLAQQNEPQVYPNGPFPDVPQQDPLAGQKDAFPNVEAAADALRKMYSPDTPTPSGVSGAVLPPPSMHDSGDEALVAATGDMMDRTPAQDRPSADTNYFRSLSGASPAAQAIMNHDTLTADQIKSLGPALDNGPSGDDTLAAIANKYAGSQEAADAIRKSLAAHPTMPQGLNSSEYRGLSPDAKAQITSWVGGAGTAPTGIDGMNVSGTATTAGGTKSIYTDPNGNKFTLGSDGGLQPATMLSDQIAADEKAKRDADELASRMPGTQDEINQLSGLSGKAAYLGLRPDQAQQLRDALKAGGAGGLAAATAVGDRMADARMINNGSHFVSPQDILNGGNPNAPHGWVRNSDTSPIPSPTKDQQDRNAFYNEQYKQPSALRYDMATSQNPIIANEAARTLAKQALQQANLTEEGKVDRTERELRMGGANRVLAEGMEGGGGAGGYNPYVAAVLPQLGAAQATAAGLGIGQTNANAQMVGAQGLAKKADIEGQEFGFSQTPLGLAQTLGRNGQPIPPELAQAAAAQALRSMQGGGGVDGQGGNVPAAAKLVPGENDIGKMTSQLINGIPEGGDLSEAGKALSIRKTPQELIEYKKRLSGDSGYTNYPPYLDGIKDPDQKYAIQHNETPEQTAIRHRQINLINKALEYSTGGPPTR